MRFKKSKFIFFSENKKVLDYLLLLNTEFYCENYLHHCVLKNKE